MICDFKGYVLETGTKWGDSWEDGQPRASRAGAEPVCLSNFPCAPSFAVHLQAYIPASYPFPLFSHICASFANRGRI